MLMVFVWRFFNFVFESLVNKCLEVVFRVNFFFLVDIGVRFNGMSFELV